MSDASVMKSPERLMASAGWKDARIRASRPATVIDAPDAIDDVSDVDAIVDSWRQGAARVQDAG